MRMRAYNLSYKKLSSNLYSDIDVEEKCAHQWNLILTMVIIFSCFLYFIIIIFMYDALLHYTFIIHFHISIDTDTERAPESDTDNSRTGIHILQYSSLKTLIHVIYSQA